MNPSQYKNTEQEDPMKSQEETIADLNTRCDGANQFENFDAAFRKSLTVSKEALLKEEARLKRARAKKRAKKTQS